MEVESNAKQLTEKLEVAQQEKQMLENEFNENSMTIDRYNKDIFELKSELENMKHVIANTFEEELQTAGSMNAASLSKKK